MQNSAVGRVVCGRLPLPHARRREPLLTDMMSRTRRVWTSVLVVYWVVLFILTHIPQVPRPPDILIPPDYVLHFSAYAVLALLCAAAWSWPRALSLRDMMALVVLLSVYGAVDEWTQIPVGRDASLGDWIANVTGIVVGAMVYRVATSRIG